MVGQSRSPLLVQCRSIVFDAGSTPLQHWPNARFFYISVYSNHWTANQCCVSDDGPTTTKHSVYIHSHFAAIAIGVTISSPVRKATTKINWPNCEIMLGHHLQHWASIIPTKSLWAIIIDLTTNISLNIIISEHKSYIQHVQKNWCTEMSTVSLTHHRSFPWIGHILRQNKPNSTGRNKQPVKSVSKLETG